MAKAKRRLDLRMPLAPCTDRWWPAGLAIAAVAGLALAAPPGAGASSPNWEAAEARTVLADLEGPIDIALADDGTVWWNELYSGNVSRYDPATDTREVLFHADPVPNPVERGLVGLALDPDVVDNGVFYVYYTVPDPEDPTGGTNHLSRIEDGEEHRLLSVPAYERHNGGRITFDGEGRLFVSTGDNTEGYPAQNTSSRLGKILHLWPNGTPAGDTIEGYVYSFGHRNVYGLAYDQVNDRLFATENNDRERDEINLVEAGHNYGWPHCQGSRVYDFEAGEPTDEPCPDDRFRRPIAEFYDDHTAAPTGATMFAGDLYWAAWNQAEIHRLHETPGGDWHDQVVYEADGRRINDVTAHNGSLYYANWTAIVEIENLGVNGSTPTEGEIRVPEDEEDGWSRIPAAQTAAALIAAGGAAAQARGRRSR